MAAALEAVARPAMDWRAGSRVTRVRRVSDRVTELRHRVAGWADGRRYLPSLDESAPAPAHLQRIGLAFASVAERRWTALLVETDDDRLTRSRLLPEMQRAATRAQVARGALDAHLGQPMVASRRFGEDRVPEDLVRRRREREHRARTEALTADRDRTRNYVTQLEQQRDELESRMLAQLELAQTEARELRDLAWMAAHAYLRGAQRSHHDPQALVAAFPRFEYRLPDWVAFDGLDEFLRAAGAERDDR